MLLSYLILFTSIKFLYSFQNSLRKSIKGSTTAAKGWLRASCVDCREKTTYREEKHGRTPSLLKMASKDEEGALNPALIERGLFVLWARQCLSHEVFRVNVASLEGMPLRNLVPRVVCKVPASRQSPLSQILTWSWVVTGATPLTRLVRAWIYMM